MVAILTRERVTTRLEHLEALMRRYPDVNPEVIVKEDMQREGFRFTEAALKAGEGKRLKTYQLFSWDHSPISAMGERTTMKVPDYIDVEGGPYSLRKMHMRPRIHLASPYLVDAVEGRLTISSEGQEVAHIRPYAPEPKYFQKRLPDGTPYHEICPPTGYVIVFRQCQHWGPEEECKFCDINENARTKKIQGQAASITPKRPEDVAEGMEEIFLREDWPPDSRPRYVEVNGGTITRTLQGKDEVEFYLRYVEAIRARLGRRWPIYLNMHPKPRAVEEEMRRRGVDQRASNLEVWDAGLFKIICPGKDRLIGRDEWIRRLLDQVQVYGEGNVTPGFVAGVEMAQPWGFKTVQDAVRSTTQGMEFLMAHGVIPRPISWCVEDLSWLRGQTPPPVEYFIELDRNWYEIWTKYRLPTPGRHLMGPGRNEYPNSAFADMGD